MAAASLDLGAMNAQRAAQAAARDQGRATVLDRFEAVDARRRFSLDLADAARADRAERLARSQVEAHDAASERARAGERRTTPGTERHGKAADRSDATDRAGTGTPRSEPASGQSAQRSEPTERTVPESAESRLPAAFDRHDAAEAGSGSRGVDAPRPNENRPGGTTTSGAGTGSSVTNRDPLKAEPESTAEPAPAAATGETKGDGNIQHTESGSADEAMPAAEGTPGIASAPSPTAQALPGAAPAQTPHASQGDTASATDHVESRMATSPVSGLERNAPRSTSEASAAALTFQASESVHDALRGAEAGISASPGTSESSTALGGGTTIASSSAAKGAASADTVAASTANQPATPPVPLSAVPMTIALRSLQNASRFEIRLDPVELGRIDVRLDIDKDSGIVSADLVVDRPATLALLQRDAGALQQALAQAGLDASAGISLSLRDGTAGGQDGGQGRDGRAPPHQATASPGAQHRAGADTIDPGPLRALRLSGLDIRI